MKRSDRHDLERRLYEFGRTIPPLRDEQRERMKPVFEPKPLAPVFPPRRNRTRVATLAALPVLLVMEAVWLVSTCSGAYPR